MGLLRGDVVDTGVVMTVVVPIKVLCEVSRGLEVVEELAGVFGGAFDARKGRLDEGVVFGRAGAREELGHAVILAE